jgi:aldehyde dehydrogenase (NAD+)
VIGNSGQTCIAPTRQHVQADQKAEVESVATRVFAATRVDSPEKEGNHIGPLVNKAQFDKVQGLIRKGIEEGATLEAGGPDRPEGVETGYFVKPTLFSNVSNDMTIAREEIFGPVVTIIPYEDDEDAIRIANESAYGLSGGVSGGDFDRAMKIARRIRTGSVGVNNGMCIAGDIPFGGYKASGIGREWGVEGIEEFLETKMIAYPVAAA